MYEVIDMYQTKDIEGERGHRDPSGIFWAKSVEIGVRNFSNNGSLFFKHPYFFATQFHEYFNLRILLID